MVDCRDVPPADSELKKPSAAWKFPTKHRDEYLVFTTIEGCQLFSPWAFVRAAVATDVEADILLCAAYLDYLEVERGNGINRARAEELLREYGYLGA